MKSLFRRLAAALLCALAALSLCGCRNGSYGSITPHLEQRIDLSEPGDLTVSNYSALLSAILRLVEQGAAEGVIRMSEYSGDAQSDVLSACRQVQTNEPLGVYLVEYMSYECVRVLTYYEARISITYRRSPEQIASIRDVSSSTAFRDLLGEALDEGAPGLIANVRYYYPEQYDAASLCDELLLADPFRCVAVPLVTTQVYPEKGSGWDRLLDISLQWGLDPSTLQARRQELTETARRLAGELTGDNPARAEALVTLAAGRIATTFDLANDLADTSYGALVLGSATSRGAACGFAALCEAAGYEWRIVPGVLAGDLHYWNMLKVGEHWYHVDITTPAPACLTTAELSESYSWDTLRFPTCIGPSLLPQPEEPEEPVTEGPEGSGEAEGTGTTAGEIELPDLPIGSDITPPPDAEIILPPDESAAASSDPANN